jgi:hypothetical protein
MFTTVPNVFNVGYLLWSVVVVVALPCGHQRTPDRLENESSGPAAKPFQLRMTKAVVCRSIDGYEQYEALPGAAQTADEKLLVYYRPLDYKTLQKDGLFTAHLTQDGQVRRQGEKTVLLRKKLLLDYGPKSPDPLGPIYLRNSFSLKGLRPGDYEYDIILRDENQPGPATIQSLKFRIVAPVLPEPSKDAK